MMLGWRRFESEVLDFREESLVVFEGLMLDLRYGFQQRFPEVCRAQSHLTLGDDNAPCHHGRAGNRKQKGCHGHQQGEQFVWG